MSNNAADVGDYDRVTGKRHLEQLIRDHYGPGADTGIPDPRDRRRAIDCLTGSNTARMMLLWIAENFPAVITKALENYEITWDELTEDAGPGAPDVPGGQAAGG
jgi:hypothetical protein